MWNSLKTRTRFLRHLPDCFLADRQEHSPEYDFSTSSRHGSYKSHSAHICVGAKEYAGADNKLHVPSRVATAPRNLRRSRTKICRSCEILSVWVPHSSSSIPATVPSLICRASKSL